jgi:hypothetical protein
VARNLDRSDAPLVPRTYRLWQDLAAYLWAQSLPITGTPAETYLEARGCRLPPEGGDVRYLPARGEHPHAMLARVTDAVTAESISLHFTRLAPDGRGKAGSQHDKRLLSGHRKVGGVIRLWPDETVTNGLAVSEGIESGLCAAHAFTPVWVYQSYGQQPISMVASSALAVVSLAAQGLADVARDDRLYGPVSLNFPILAQSGERKTGADRALGAMLAEWERARADALREPIKRNCAELEAWSSIKEGIKTALRDTVKKHPDRVTELSQQLEAHELTKPAEIIAPRLRYEDVNPQSLAYSLAKGHPSAAIWSDEGGMATGSLGMGKDSLLGFMATLNRLWDGGSIHHDRKQAESVHLEGLRLTVSIMVQPSVLQELSSRSSGLTRGSGFLARFLVAAPASTMGTRMYREPPQGMPALSAFNGRITALLDVQLPLDDHGRLTPALLRLTSAAASIWRDYHDEIERQLVPLGVLREIPDFAAKSAETAVRIAGCLHMLDGTAGADHAGGRDVGPLVPAGSPARAGSVGRAAGLG